MQPDMQLIQLVQLMNEISNRGKLDWTKTADDSGLRVVLNGGLVRIKQSRHYLEGDVVPPESIPVYSISVRDRNGAVVVGDEGEYTRNQFEDLAHLHDQASANFQERSIQLLMDELRSKLVEK